MLAIIGTVLIVIERMTSMNVVGLLMIVEVAAQMAYGGSSKKEKQMKQTSMASDKLHSLV